MKHIQFMFTLLACLLVPMAAFAQDNQAVPADTQLGKFSLLPNVSINMLLMYDNNEIIRSEEGYTRVDYDPVMNNFPEPGWQTLKVNMFTGGANCCMGYYLLSESGEKAAAVYIPPADQYMVRGGKDFIINDPHFMYYELDAGNEVKISLNRVESPRISRQVVFADNKWRVDRPGEFPDFYNKLIAEINNEMPPLNRDISMAYYGLMAGKSVAVVRQQFMASPAAEYKDAYPLLFQDIEKAINQFAPLQELDLNTK